MAANRAIEDAYKEQFPTGVLYGSDFEPFEFGHREVEPPKGFIDSSYARRLILALRGRRFQYPPDIIDFERRVIYEFKTVTSAERNPGSVRAQLESYYRVAQELHTDFAGPDDRPFQQTQASWYPPHFLRMWSPTRFRRAVCTSATDYNAWPEGLILYSVLESKRRRRKRKLKAKSARIIDFHREMGGLRSDIINQLLSVPQLIDEEMPYHVIVASRRFFDTWQGMVQDRLLEKASEYSLPPYLDRKHPVNQFRRVGWTVIGISTAAFAASIAASIALVPASAVVGPAAVSAAAGGGSAGGGQVISLAAYRAMMGSPAVANAARAAGVLIVAGYVTDAKAETPEIEDADVIRAVPIRDFDLSDAMPAARSDNVEDDVPDLTEDEVADLIRSQFRPGWPVSLDGSDHTIVGIVRLAT
ncbi:MAG: hypothetical protein R3D62_03090 [Xanthobacteraceae bacterium]